MVKCKRKVDEMNIFKEMISRNGKVSNSKFWAFIANALVCAIVVKTHIIGDALNVEFILMFLGVVGGVGLTSKFIEKPASVAKTEQEIPSNTI